MASISVNFHNGMDNARVVIEQQREILLHEAEFSGAQLSLRRDLGLVECCGKLLTKRDVSIVVTSAFVILFLFLVTGLLLFSCHEHKNNANSTFTNSAFLSKLC